VLATKAPRRLQHYCGADAAQFLLFEQESFLVLGVSIRRHCLAALLLNLFTEHAAITVQFAAITISYIPKSSPLLCLHLLNVSGFR
jgi:hypothetical protein